MLRKKVLNDQGLRKRISCEGKGVIFRNCSKLTDKLETPNSVSDNTIPLQWSSLVSASSHLLFDSFLICPSLLPHSLLQLSFPLFLLLLLLLFPLLISFFSSSSFPYFSFLSSSSSFFVLFFFFSFYSSSHHFPPCLPSSKRI